MFNNKNKQNKDLTNKMDFDSPSSKGEDMDVEVLANASGSDESSKKRRSEFGFEDDEDDFEQYSNEDESRPCGLIEYRFENLSRVDRNSRNDSRYLSSAVKIRCLPWKILLLFTKDDLGIFVQCNGEADTGSWNCTAKAKIELVSQAKENCSKINTITHNFTQKENDWGYRSYIRLEELYASPEGYIVNDSLMVKARIEAEAPHGADWDSKKHTGFVGLKNQGATCYLNSLLQTLYFTNKLRKAVFLMPTESDDSQTSVPLALQRVFHELQFSDRAVGTKKLTRSFGWATLDSFMQHDAQELCRVLLDNLESKMKGTSVEDVIPSLFCGKMLSYIRCTNVAYESKREENFYDIQLKVKGNETVYDAFREYIAVETLDNENKYDAGSHGLQPAEKGVIFLKFPPVLYLQLMRFQYDYQTDMNVKINDRFEFPYRLNLDEFLKEKDPSRPATYFLHAVLVHSGDNHGGHYVVFLNPRGDRNWYEFDDDVVSRCERKAAIHQNYGGSHDSTVRSSSNAYMLVYIAESAKDDVLCPVEERDIPDYLLERFQEETRIEEMKHQEKLNAHYYTLIHLILEEDLYGYEGPSLFTSETVTPRAIRVHKELDLNRFVNEVAQSLGRPANTIRIWKVQRKKDNIYRLINPELIHGSNLQADPFSCTYFIQYIDPPATGTASLLYSDNNTENIFPTMQSRHMLMSKPVALEFDPMSRLIFVKYFDRIAFALRYCGMLYEPNDVTFAQIRTKLLDFVDLPHDTEILIFRLDHNEQLNLLIEGNYRNFTEDMLIFTTLRLDQQNLCSPIFDDMALTPENGAEQGHDALQMLSVGGTGGLMDNQENAARNGTGERFMAVSGSGEAADVDANQLRRALLASHIEQKLRQDKDAILSDPLSFTRLLVRHYIEEFANYVEILLVDKNRHSDPGILLTVRHQISYWEFARCVGKILGVDPNFLQFFRSQHVANPTSVIPATVLPPQSQLNNVNVNSPVGQPQDAHDTSTNNSSVLNLNAASGGTTGTGMTDSTGTPSPASHVSNLLSSQAIAAKASGFSSCTLQNTTLLASAASLGLAKEPPGASIISSLSDPMSKYLMHNDFLSSPSYARIGNTALNPYPQPMQVHKYATRYQNPALVNSSNYPNSAVGNANTQALLNGERMPFPISRYSSSVMNQTTSLGSYTRFPPRRVYYAHLNISIAQLETMRQVRCVYVGPKLNDQLDLLLSVPQTGTVLDLLNEARHHVPPALTIHVAQAGTAPPASLGKLRLLEVQNGRIMGELPPDLSIMQLSAVNSNVNKEYGNLTIYRIEEIPVDELEIGPDEKIVWVMHIESESHKPFGVPFSIRLKNNEIYQTVKERMRKRLEVPEKEFERWRLLHCHTKLSYLPDEGGYKVDLALFQANDAINSQPYLCIEHKQAKRARYAPSQKPIKIHN